MHQEDVSRASQRERENGLLHLRHGAVVVVVVVHGDAFPCIEPGPGCPSPLMTACHGQSHAYHDRAIKFDRVYNIFTGSSSWSSGQIGWFGRFGRIAAAVDFVFRFVGAILLRGAFLRSESLKYTRKSGESPFLPDKVTILILVIRVSSHSLSRFRDQLNNSVNT